MTDHVLKAGQTATGNSGIRQGCHRGFAVKPTKDGGQKCINFFTVRDAGNVGGKARIAAKFWCLQDCRAKRHPFTVILHREQNLTVIRADKGPIRSNGWVAQPHAGRRCAAIARLQIGYVHPVGHGVE
jgi:hypothetical protein